MRIFQKGFNFSQDGPGNRLVYHLQGCNMRCPWCSNPEGMALSGGKEYSIEEIVTECQRSRAMFFSGGGVTFTGGEATVQYDELAAVLRALHREGIHTAIETNGTSKGLVELCRDAIDYLIMDVKHHDPEVHRALVGVPLTCVLENYRALCRMGRQLHVRIPLINHVNADDAEQFAALLSSEDTSAVVFEFLRYHEYGKEKATREYTVRDGFVTAEQVRKFEEAFRAHGLKTVRT